jgi:hypothetical protein
MTKNKLILPTVHQMFLWYDICMNKTKCFFCDKEATHLDVVVDHADYIVADVCNKHLQMGLSS